VPDPCDVPNFCTSLQVPVPACSQAALLSQDYLIDRTGDPDSKALVPRPVVVTGTPVPLDWAFVLGNGVIEPIPLATYEFSLNTDYSGRAIQFSSADGAGVVHSLTAWPTGVNVFQTDSVLGCPAASIEFGSSNAYDSKAAWLGDTVSVTFTVNFADVESLVVGESDVPIRVMIGGLSADQTNRQLLSDINRYRYTYSVVLLASVQNTAVLSYSIYVPFVKYGGVTAVNSGSTGISFGMHNFLRIGVCCYPLNHSMAHHLFILVCFTRLLQSVGQRRCRQQQQYSTAARQSRGHIDSERHTGRESVAV